ncbi:acetyl-CoA carboxylase carboxyltransferase subunit alpha [Pontiellaceae bacterium B1224]|nr:acetyl-CoA carboxylase carboxyltransferase subunit alpha [Pontiellaceae bacterium B1224]
MSAQFSLPFESPVHKLESKLKELEAFSQEQDIDVSHEINNMKDKIEQTRNNIYANLTAWQKVQVARHPNRPYTMDYIESMTTDFVEIHGDRIHRDDRAIVGGFAKIDGQKVMIIGSQKGRDTKSNVETNFGCAHPEGYRKALRMMKLADKFNVPIVTLIDTKGAYAGLESEERHIAEAIAVNLRECFNIKVPIICVIIGEGGSGGALGIGIGNRILIMEHAYYSVISPEGCAAILWKDRAFSDQAAEALKITGKDLLKLKLADEIIPEPQGGAHADLQKASENLKLAILKNLEELNTMSAEEILQDRYNKFRVMGEFEGSVE